MKFCKDCKWASSLVRFAKCEHPSSWHGPQSNPVTGAVEPGRFYYANTQRESLVPGDCGRDARHWEPRATPPSFWELIKTSWRVERI